jgi:TolA-binding protein
MVELGQNEYRQLVERIERLEQSFAQQTQTTVQMLSTLEHISKTLEDMVNGKGTIRCVEHGAHMAAVEKMMSRNHTEAIGYTRRVEEEFHEYRKYSHEETVNVSTKVHNLEKGREKLIGGLIATQILVGLAVTMAIKFF